MQRTSGFTLIELIIVIVLLGILSAVALPRFMDLSGDAHAANAQGTASSLAVGANLARSKYLINPQTTDFDGNGTTITFTNGWPTGVDGVGEFTASADACVSFWNAVLSSGGATVDTAVGDGVDYVAVADANGCLYEYRGNVPNTQDAIIVIQYNQTTGGVSVTTP